MPPTLTEVFFCAHADVFSSNKLIVSFGKNIGRSCQSISWPTQSFLYKLQNISHLSVLTSTERRKVSPFLILFFFFLLITTLIGCSVLAKTEQWTATGNGESFRRSRSESFVIYQGLSILVFTPKQKPSVGRIEKAHFTDMYFYHYTI